MTRKHFEKIAEIIRSNKAGYFNNGLAQKNDLIDKLSNYFITINTRFDKEKFKYACMFEKKGGQIMDNNFMDNVEKSLKELIKEINTLNKILLSSDIGVNLRNTPIDRANKVSKQYEKLLKELK